MIWWALLAFSCFSLIFNFSLTSLLPQVPLCSFIIVWFICFFFFSLTVFIFYLLIWISKVSTAIYILIHQSIPYNFYLRHIFISRSSFWVFNKAQNISTFLNICVIFIVTILISLSTNSIIYVRSRSVLIDWVFSSIWVT